jgi:dihydrofolate reductase
MLLSRRHDEFRPSRLSQSETHGPEEEMRKVIESTLVSVDGVIGEPHKWTGEHFGEEAVAIALEQLRRSDAMVMGRRTYEMFSNIWPTPADEYAAAIYDLRKYVFSSTLEQADWNNTSIITEDVAAAVSDLKRQDGQDIVLYGHGPVGQALVENKLLDELKLWVHPVVVGSGKLLFRESARSELKLMETATTKTGVVILTYRPAHT